MRSRTYQIYGIILLALLFYVQLIGWSWTDVDEVKQVPRTVRDNPGSYRAHYNTYIHYHGGK